MLLRLRHLLGYLLLLLLFLPGLVLTSAGESRAHGTLSAAASEAAHQESEVDRHGHAHDHVDDREQGDGRHLHHEIGSHFHETADCLAAGVSLAPRFRDALRIGGR
ncbi:hypothetical protein [Halomonas korlensis]|uniref:Uncharacterized protein n=1 Tax=Halomonas korlensis TaxID=463301 RepID=A0A1I7I5P6_9GAMM|nr:hypothetical protein [Halomonas korlensis]SFU68280.1 hypothetical protein SAMN04487955_10647 [Halomonas korlensis]